MYDVALVREAVERQMIRVVGGWSCAVCRYTSKYTTDVRRHIESRHLAGMNHLECRYCGHMAANMAGFLRHHRLQHAEQIQ